MRGWERHTQGDPLGRSASQSKESASSRPMRYPVSQNRCFGLPTHPHTHVHTQQHTCVNKPMQRKLHLGEDSGLQGQAGFVKQGHGVRTGGTLWRKTSGSAKDFADCGWCRLPMCVLGTYSDLRPEIVKGLHEETSCFNEGHRKGGRGRRREGEIRIADNSELWIFQ